MIIDIFHIFKITMLRLAVVKLYNFNSCSTYEIIYCPQMIQPFFCSLRENSVCFPIPSKEEIFILPLIFLFPGSLIWLLEQDSKLPSSAFTRVNRRWCSGPVKILKTQTALVLWPTEADVNIKGRNCFFLLGKVMEAKEPESGLSSGLAGTAGQLSVWVHSAVPSHLCLQIRDLASRPAGLDCVLRSPGKLISAQWFV